MSTIPGKSMRAHLLEAFRGALSPLSTRLHMLVDAEATHNKMLIEWAAAHDRTQVAEGCVLLNIHPQAVRDYVVQEDRVSFYCKRAGVSHYVSVHVDDIIGVVHPTQGWTYPVDTTVVVFDGVYALTQEGRDGSAEPESQPEPVKEAKPRPTLRVVK